MIDRFIHFINKAKLFDPREKILLTVSGGIDSMVMMHLFYAAGLRFGVAHCNFKLRGHESDADEALVREKAESIDTEVFVTSFHTTLYAREEGISIQMAARELRYQWFEEIRTAHEYDWIATAHHQDDHSETVLINLVRGTGLRGLKGIPLKTGKIIRPLACFSRSEIEDYVQKHHIPFRQDASNADDKYLRSKIRHQMVPFLKRINPSLDQSMMDLSKMANEAMELLQFFIEKEIKPHLSYHDDRLIISIPAILAFPATGLILFELLRPYNFPPKVVDHILSHLHSQPGKLFYSPTHVCLKDRTNLIISRYSQTDITDTHLIHQGQTSVTMGDEVLTCKLRKVDASPVFLNDSSIALLDADKLKYPLKLRHPREGDHFIPLGMSGKKKISDFLTDVKVPLTLKNKTWLLISDNTIVWVVGHRIHEHFKVRKSTHNLLEITYQRTKG